MSADWQALTPQLVCDWLASAAEEDDPPLQYRTISGYRSALVEWYATRSQCTGANPARAEAVDRVLQGIKRECTAREVEKRAARIVTVSLTPLLLRQLKPHLVHPISTPFQRMVWAACCLGVHGLLRPNEFVGTYGLEHRALRAQQLRFFSAENRPVCPYTEAAAEPAAMEIRLGVTKADPFASNAPLRITAPEAVSALWEWLVEWIQSGERRESIWACPFERQLSIQTLLSLVRQALIDNGVENPLVTGRCFRRGGALSLVLAGASTQQVMAAGRWATAPMVKLYAGQPAQNAGK